MTLREYTFWDYHGSLWNVFVTLYYTQLIIFFRQLREWHMYAILLVSWRCHQNRILPNLVRVQDLPDSYHNGVILLVANRLIYTWSDSVIFRKLQFDFVILTKKPNWCGLLAVWREPDSKVTTTIQGRRNRFGWSGFRRTTFWQSSNEYSKCYAHVVRACKGTCKWCSTEVEGHILH